MEKDNKEREFGFNWLKLHKAYLRDAEFSPLPDNIKWHYFAMYLLAGEARAEGLIAQNNKPLDIKKIAWLLNITEVEMKNSITLLIDAELVHFEDNAYFISRFLDEQGPSFVTNEMRDYWTKIQKKHRGETKKKNQNSESDIESDKRVETENREEQIKESEPDIRTESDTDIDQSRAETVNDMSLTNSKDKYIDLTVPPRTALQRDILKLHEKEAFDNLEQFNIFNAWEERNKHEKRLFEKLQTYEYFDSMFEAIEKGDI